MGTAYVRLDGLEHLYGGEARLVNAILNAVPQDLAPRVGVADAKFPALVASTVSQPSRATRVPADAASFIAPHTIDLLPVSTDLQTALHRFSHISKMVPSIVQVCPPTCTVDRTVFELWLGGL